MRADGDMYLLRGDWRCSLVGSTVEIRRAGAVVRIGCVDEATADSRFLWLASDGINQRVLIDKTLGYQAWLRYHRKAPTEADAASPP
jgi:hypothetical protein